MDAEIDKMADRQIEEMRIWIPRETLVNGGGTVYVGHKWSDSDIEYVRTETEQPAISVHYCNNCGSRDVVTQFSKQQVGQERIQIAVSSLTPEESAEVVHTVDVRERAEKAADKLNAHGLFTQGTSLVRVADIIAAEFEK